MWISVKKSPRPIRVASSAPVIYLDWNVFVSLRRAELPGLAGLLQSLVSDGHVVVPFSATHVDELRVPSSGASTDDLLDNELRWLGEITNGAYLYDGDDVPSPILTNEDPKTVWNTIRDVPGASEAADGLLGLLSAPVVRHVRNESGLDPRELNNIQPPNVLAQLDQRLVTLFGGTGVTSMKALVQQATKFHPQGETFGFSHEIAALFTLLNLVGLRPDKDFTGTKRRGSFNDASHVALSACTDAFVSHDTRLRIKAAAAFEYLVVETRVMDVHEAVTWLKEMG